MERKLEDDTASKPNNETLKGGEFFTDQPRARKLELVWDAFVSRTC